MSANLILSPGTGSISGFAIDTNSAPFTTTFVRNPMTADTNCANLNLVNVGRVNSSILETEQIQLKPGSLLTAITLGTNINATNGCTFIAFSNPAPRIECSSVASLSLGNVAEGAGVVIDCSANLVTITGDVSAQLSQVGTATILATAQSVSVADTAITASSVVLVQVSGVAPDASAKSFSVALSDGVGFDIVADAPATADVVLTYFVAKY